MARARVTSKGQVTVPKAVRERLDLKPGDSLEFEFTNGHLEVRPVRRRSISEFFGIFPAGEAPNKETASWEEMRARGRDARVRELMDRTRQTEARLGRLERKAERPANG
jgi:AbrB family looped-hinge helix DNA binding protein